MRVKRQKRNRKKVRFFSSCFGFHEPYKVLIDGTFIHHLLLHDLTPDAAISHLLGGRVQIFASSCTVSELRALGVSESNSLSIAELLIPARCGHDRRMGVAKCIKSIVVDEGNKEHFFVATQDVELRRDLQNQELAAVPVIYGIRNSLFIDRLSSNHRNLVKSAEEKRLHLSESECQRVFYRTGTEKKLEDSHSLDPLSTEQDPDAGSIGRDVKVISKRTRLGVESRVRFKRKRAKGPNPLSCLKKKAKKDPDGPSGSHGSQKS